MVAFAPLWLPIVLAAVIVFLAQSVMHVVLKYHNREWRSRTSGWKRAQQMPNSLLLLDGRKRV